MALSRKANALQVKRRISHSAVSRDATPSYPLLAIEKSLLLYLYAVLVPACFVASSIYLAVPLRSALSWTYFNIFPWNFALFSALFLAGVFWIFWAMPFGAQHVKGRLPDGGPYLYCRNPKGFGYLLVLAGLSLMLQSAVAIFVLFPLIVLSYVLYLKLLEEPLMKIRFGNAFEEYRSSIPLLFPLPVRLRKHL